MSEAQNGVQVCDWCGRAIYPEGALWLAVKGQERRYPRAVCDANPHAVCVHEPARRSET